MPLANDVKSALLAVVEDWRRRWHAGDGDGATEYSTELLAILNPLVDRGQVTSNDVLSILMAASADINGQTPGAVARKLEEL